MLLCWSILPYCRYCLMSVAGCYTDFHLDFGGTSVWYHILKGEKVFFLVPPSPTAYCRFEEWQKHGQQEKTFFPDIVEHCAMIHLKEGDTLLLPSGEEESMGTMISYPCIHARKPHPHTHLPILPSTVCNENTVCTSKFAIPCQTIPCWVKVIGADKWEIPMVF